MHKLDTIQYKFQIITAINKEIKNDGRNIKQLNVKKNCYLKPASLIGAKNFGFCSLGRVAIIETSASGMLEQVSKSSNSMKKNVIFYMFTEKEL